MLEEHTEPTRPNSKNKLGKRKRILDQRTRFEVVEKASSSKEANAVSTGPSWVAMFDSLSLRPAKGEVEERKRWRLGEKEMQVADINRTERNVLDVVGSPFVFSAC